jgi:hypothetical protein
MLSLSRALLLSTFRIFGGNVVVEVLVHGKTGMTSTFSYDMRVDIGMPSWSMRVEAQLAASAYTPYSAPVEDWIVKCDSAEAPLGAVGQLREEVVGDTTTTDTRTSVEEVDLIAPLAEEGQPTAEVDVLAPEVSGVTKYACLGDALAASGAQAAALSRGAPVLVLGGSPGTLTQRLLALRIPVVEIDSQPAPTRIHSGEAVYRYVQAVLTSSDHDWGGLYPSGLPPPSLVVSDIATADEMREADTQLNSVLAQSASMHWQCAWSFKARCMPRVAGRFYVLNVPTTVGRSVETFWLSLHNTAPQSMGLLSLWQADVSAGGVRSVVTLRPAPGLTDRGLWIDELRRRSILCTDEGAVSITTSSQWALAMRIRHVMSAREAATTSSGQAILSDRPLYEVWKEIAGRHVPGSLDRQGRPTFVRLPTAAPAETAVGADAIMMNPYTGALEHMRAREEHLMGYAAQGDLEPPAALAALFAHPASGGLLADLSAVTDGMVAPRLPRYRRLLPLSHKYALGSRLLFCAVDRYCRFLVHTLGVHIHGWELEYLLWRLSNFGTLEDKLAYLATEALARINFRGTARKYVREEGRRRSAVNAFRNLVGIMSDGHMALSAVDAELASVVGSRSTGMARRPADYGMLGQYGHLSADSGSRANSARGFRSSTPSWSPASDRPSWRG